MTVSNCTVSGNSAHNDGGGIHNSHATAEISASTLSGNSTGFNGGGLVNDGGDSGSATMTVRTSTLSSNSAGNVAGGIWNNSEFSGSATLMVSASTLSGNSADAEGGGIENDGFESGNATLKVSASTLSGNSAPVGGGIFNGCGPGSAALEIGDTILNAGVSGANLTNFSGNGTVTSSGFNLSSDGTGPNNGTNDQLNANPMLGPLQNNGGPTFTHALLAGSPAIDKGKRDTIPALGVDTDQRGQPRPFENPGIPNASGGDGSDIGAFELQALLPTVKLLVPDKNASEPGSNTGLFRIRRTGPTDAPLTVFYSIGGSATPGVDYKTLSGMAIISAGRHSEKIRVSPKNDNRHEGNETVKLTLMPDPNYVIGSPGMQTVTIHDND